MKKCVFAGTFDPPTIGHQDIVLKCLEIFDEVVVALMINPNKQPLFKTEDRLMLLEKGFFGTPERQSRRVRRTFGGSSAQREYQILRARHSERYRLRLRKPTQLHQLRYVQADDHHFSAYAAESRAYQFQSCKRRAQVS